MMTKPTLAFLLVSMLATTRFPQGGGVPAPRILNPQSEMAVTGQVLIEARQDNPNLQPFEIRSTCFEYSADGERWTLIDEVTDLLPDFRGADPGNWRAMWDTRELASGPYALRTTMTTLDGARETSPALLVTVRKPPIAHATAAAGDEPGSVIFDGSASSASPGGEIVAWTWEFDDGTTTTGRAGRRTFDPAGGPYTVYLTVADEQGFQFTECFKLVFDTITELFKFFTCDPGCVCKNARLRGTIIPRDSRALGPDGRVTGQNDDKWPATQSDDGMTLGPLKNNPTNRALGMIMRGKFTYMGYAYEVIFDVDGRPADCKEGQLTKGTVVYRAPGLNAANCQQLGGTFDAAQQACTIPKKWTGKTADLDKDGTIDIDASTPFKCVALGGTVVAGGNCKLTFPQSGNQYGPDGYESAAYPSKEHPGSRVVWYDSPSAGGGIGSTQNGDFLAFLRGTDDRYCYVGFRLKTERTPAGRLDTEDLILNAEGRRTTTLPGVP